MKSTTAAAVLAFAASAMAVAIPVEVLQARADTVCIDFTSEVGTWYYTLQAPWGSGSQEVTSKNSQLCVPKNQTAGGALFLGPDANPGAGSTKLEGFFPETVTDAKKPNFDVSLVDGYSLSVSCTATGYSTVIGGSVDLWSTGTACPQQEGPNCINANGGETVSQDEINAFFQPATQNGNNYCIWAYCAQIDYPVNQDDSPALACTISGTAK